MSENKSIYGIIGNPVKHSLSPLMHNAAFESLELDAVYKLIPLETDELEGFFQDLKKENSPIFGLNVTVPYKEAVLPFLDSVSPLASKLNAVNTIFISKDRKLIGHNTDAPGFLAHLVELGFNTAGKRITMLGAGGSARAILGTLCMIPEKPESIKIYNRTYSRITQLLDDLGARIDMSIVEPVSDPDDLNVELADMLINTTSLGLKDNDICLVDPYAFHSNLLVYDLIYNPYETALLKVAREKGSQISNGLGMLFYQGVLAFQHWAETELDDEVKSIMRNALEEGLLHG